jgi:HAUS augmin-like complex subunit 3
VLCLIREATASYKTEALALQKRLQRLQSQLELLGGQTSSLIQGRRARTAAAAGAAGNLSMIEEKLVGRNLEVLHCFSGFSPPH